MKILKFILLNIFLFIILVPIAEFSLRYKRFNSLSIPEPIYVYDSLLAFKNNPKHPNSSGGPIGGYSGNLKIKKKFRIICLGGSSTAGYGLSGEKSWPKQLEKKFKSDSTLPSIEVLNLAVGGYGTGHLKKMLKYRAYDIDPDLVLVYTGWNGIGVLGDKYAWAPTNVKSPQDNFWVRLDKYFQNHVYFYLYYIRKRVEKIIEMQSLRNINKEMRARKQNNSYWKKDIDAMRSTMETKAVPYAFIGFPSWEKPLMARGTEYVNMIKEREAYLLAQDVFDSNIIIPMQTEYFRMGKRNDQALFFDRMHLNAAGSIQFADDLYLKLLKPQYLHFLGNSK